MNAEPTRRLDQMSPDQKAKLLAELLRKRTLETPQTQPLSEGQQALYFLHRLHPQSASYNSALCLRILSVVDVAALRRVFDTLVERHAILRTTYAVEEGRALQKVQGVRPPAFVEVDAAGWSEAELKARVQAAYERPFDLEKTPPLRVELFRRADSDAVLLITLHHIARDGWSSLVLLDEIERLYVAETGGRAADLPPLTATYADFVREEANCLASPRGETLRAYWLAETGQAPPVLDIAPDRPRGAARSGRGAAVRLTLDAAFTASVRTLARSVGATTASVLLTAYQLLLHHHSGQAEILVGTPAFNRSGDGRHDRTVGYFVNPVCVRSVLDGEAAVRTLLADGHARLLGAISHQNYPLSRLVRDLGLQRDAGGLPLFQTLFSHVRSRGDGGVDNLVLPGADDGARIRFAGLTVAPFLLHQEEGQFDLAMEVIERDGGLHVCLKYDPDLFDAARMGRIAGHYQQILAGLCEDPSRRVAEISPLTEAERAELLAAAPPASIPPVTLDGLVAEQAARTPDAPAVRCGEALLSYAELDARVAALARALAGPGPLVAGVYLEAGIDQVVAVLGVLRAGGTYVPLDPTYPERRIELMAQDAGLSVILAEGPLPAGLSAAAPLVEQVSALVQKGGVGADEAPPCAADPSATAYLIYTSGSTGRPKGVRIAHSAAVNLLAGVQELIKLGPADTLLAITSLSFDIALLELLAPLSVGACLEIAGRELARDPTRLAARLDSREITAMQATPTTWRLVVDAGWRGAAPLQALCGGEALPRPLADDLLARATTVWNLYGPTETTIWSTAERLKADDAGVLIGRPIRNTRAYVLNALGGLAPVGAPGELHLAGAGVAQGYHARADLTAERFVPDLVEPAERMYRTGDMVRRLMDGRLEYLGRADGQMKLHGHRIERQEIENALLQHPGVAQAAVVKQGEAVGEARLVAFFVATGDGAPDPADLRDFLLESLPSFMAPAAFVALDALPLTPNLKIDRKALAELSVERPPSRSAFVAPQDALESLLADHWRRVLSLDRVGVRDNFFDLGGASIQCVNLVALAEGAGVPLTVEDIFRHQTIEAMAAALRGRTIEIVDPLHSHPVGVSVPLHLMVEHEALSKRFADAGPSLAPLREPGLLIESLGVYLPEAELSTRDVVAGCAVPLQIDLERLTGIRSRRRAGEGEFAFDIACRAVEDCLARSGHAPADVDLIICANISRYDGPSRITFEPGTAVRLKHRFGFDGALAFDISNACAGTFTALAVADAFVRNGQARRALIVSGEYVSHLTTNAQQEIEGLLDPRLACLTVGDAGIAMMLEQSTDPEVGFLDLDLFTLSQYSRACIAGPGRNGGPIMLTDAVTMTDVGIRQGLGVSLEALVRSGLPIEAFDHFVMHQTSSMTIANATREINNLFRREACNAGNTIDNLAQRGNTATTSHFVAVADHMRGGRIGSGDRIFFSVSGSGISLGTALYRLDDLPERMRTGAKAAAAPARPPPPRRVSRARIVGVGLAAPDAAGLETVSALSEAALACLSAAGRGACDLDLLIHAGVYRSDFILEPAIAALVAGEIDANAATVSGERRTLAFDVFSGGVGALAACRAAMELFAVGRKTLALITAGEVDNNAGTGEPLPYPLAESACAILLEPSDTSGLGRILQRDFPEHAAALETYGAWRNGVTYIDGRRAPDLEARFIDSLEATASELLALEGLDPESLAVVVAPQISASFLQRLEAQLGWRAPRFVDVTRTEGDLLTAGFGFGLDRAMQDAGPGDVGLILAAGSGVQTAGALYYF